MDQARAKRIFGELTNGRVGDWHPVELLGYGKSAVVMKARRQEEVGALKVFDPDLVERFGVEAQLQRVERELSLRGKNCPTLVRIIDGGLCPGTKYLFVVMECLDENWQCLADCLEQVPRERIWTLIGCVAQAARYLENEGLVHRDIKPQNIVVNTQFSFAKLLDLGVIRPIGVDSFTDEEGKPFIGTARYSPQEFLFREEKDTPEGWRAITFYQLGGVLHDMIMRNLLFADYSEPFARLVDAVKDEKPTVNASDVAPDLIVLCQNCLLKSPDLRLKLMRWESFEEPDAENLDVTKAVKDRVRKRRIAAASSMELPPVSAEQIKRKNRQVLEEMVDLVRSSVRLACASNDDFPHLEIRDIHVERADHASFYVSFKPSAPHALNKHLVVVWVVSLLDADGNVCEVTAGHAVSDIQPTPNICEALEKKVMHRGVLEKSVIVPLVLDTLYEALDLGQQTQ